MMITILISIKNRILLCLPIFSSSEPDTFKALEKIIPDNVLLLEIINSLEKKYVSSGINLFKINNTFAFRTSFEVAIFNIEKITPETHDLELLPKL